MTDGTLYLFCLWLLWASAWLTLIGVGYGIVIGAIKLFRWLRAWFIARRNERLLEEARENIRIARATKLAFRMGWLPDDYRSRRAKFGEDCW